MCVSFANSEASQKRKGASKENEWTGAGLAAFYTPPKVAQALTDWAIRDAHSLVLDPSYGGCAFLNAAFNTLISKGSHQPQRQIFGVDLDPTAKRYLSDLIIAGASHRQYINQDFFEVNPLALGGQLFDAVVGNPPYVRYHDIPENLQKHAKLRLEQYGVHLSGRASYWAFFLLYSMHFLRRGGRLAMVLPGALLHTDYSAQVREHLLQHFETVTIYLLQERIFEGTQEESVIVCAEGAGKLHKTLQICHASTVDDLRGILANTHAQARVIRDELNDGGWLRALIKDECLDVYNEATKASDVIRLGDWVKTQIGVVTGNNSYFILSQKERKAAGIPEKYFVPVIRRPAYISGLTAKNSDLKILQRQDKDYLLLNPPEKLWQMPKSLRVYIEKGEKLKINDAYKCKSRTPWYIVPHTYVPEAFIPCMSASWSRVMVNRSDYTCTNNIIRLSWRERRPALDWTRLALGTLSTLSQLSAELVGRSYGGGVLKLEPTELTRLAIPVVPQEVTQSLARQVDALLWQNKQAEATDAIDAALLDTSTYLTKPKLNLLRAARDMLFLRRRQHRKDATKIIKVDYAS